MNTDPMNNRPMDLLDECQAKYGLDRLRSVSDNSRCYYRVCVFDREADEWTAEWKLGGIGESITDVMTDTFGEVLRQTAQAVNRGETRLAPHCDGLMVVISGTGHYVVRTPDGREWAELTEEEQTVLREGKDSSAPLPKGYDPTETVPTRLSILISLEGMAREVSVLPPGLDPIVERMEEWINGDEPTTPNIAGNDIDQSVLSLFTFIQILNETVRQGRSFDLSGILETAANIPQEVGGREMTAFLLRLVSLGVENGLFDLSDLSGGNDDD